MNVIYLVTDVAESDVLESDVLGSSYLLRVPMELRLKDSVSKNRCKKRINVRTTKCEVLKDMPCRDMASVRAYNTYCVMFGRRMRAWGVCSNGEGHLSSVLSRLSARVVKSRVAVSGRLAVMSRKNTV